MDALGHVHNARFLEYYEAARADLVEEIISIDRPTGIGLVVGRHEIDYLVPLIYRPAPLAVDLWTDRIGTTSFTVGSTVGEPDGSVIYGRARTVVVAIDTATGRPRPLPDEVRSVLSAYLLDEPDEVST